MLPAAPPFEGSKLSGSLACFSHFSFSISNGSGGLLPSFCGKHFAPATNPIMAETRRQIVFPFMPEDYAPQAWKC
jgi:hypothetical protein